MANLIFRENFKYGSIKNAKTEYLSIEYGNVLKILSVIDLEQVLNHYRVYKVIVLFHKEKGYNYS